jgi:8-oxo-dGTP pyrophosphatase MutT (NUDIX family)
VSSECACGSEISLEDIRCRLEGYTRPALTLPPARTFRSASVLIPLACEAGQWNLLYTRRTELMRNHKGQISFPGGSAEPEDTSREATALRETSEEVGIQAGKVQILGSLWEMPTITGYLITPVVGCIPWPIELRLAIDEVSRAFLVPLHWLADPENHEEVPLTLPDGRNEKVVYFNPYQGEKIWGATARITLNFLRAIGWMEP